MSETQFCTLHIVRRCTCHLILYAHCDTGNNILDVDIQASRVSFLRSKNFSTNIAKHYLTTTTSTVCPYYICNEFAYFGILLTTIETKNLRFMLSNYFGNILPHILLFSDAWLTFDIINSPQMNDSLAYAAVNVFC